MAEATDTRESLDVDHDDAVWFDLEHRLPEVIRALREHASQLTVDGAQLVHSGGQREDITTSVGLRLRSR
jgi:N-acetyl-1-D-myo-inositol-2-amino-2-deoxy-alpha-D-glucopyranoside deacetylase